MRSALHPHETDTQGFSSIPCCCNWPLQERGRSVPYDPQEGCNPSEPFFFLLRFLLVTWWRVSLADTAQRSAHAHTPAIVCQYPRHVSFGKDREVPAQRLQCWPGSIYRQRAVPIWFPGYLCLGQCCK